MKHKRLICKWESIGVEIYLEMIKVLSRVRNVLEVDLW